MSRRASHTPLSERRPGTLHRIHRLNPREFNLCDLLHQYQGVPVQAHEIARGLRMTQHSTKRFLWTAEQVGLVERVELDSCTLGHGRAQSVSVTSGWLLTPIGTVELAAALAVIDQRIEEEAVA